MTADGYRILQQLRNKGERNNSPLFIYDHYAVYITVAKPFSLDHNPISRLRNAMIAELTNHDRLPKHIIVILGQNIVEIGPLADKALDWLLQEFSRISIIRQEHLAPRAKCDHDTWFTIIKPMSRPEDTKKSKLFMKLKRSVNTQLDLLLKKYTTMRYFNIDSIRPTDLKYYDHKGKPSAQGFTKFWKYLDSFVKYVDQAIKEFRARSFLHQQKVRTK